MYRVLRMLAAVQLGTALVITVVLIWNLAVEGFRPNAVAPGKVVVEFPWLSAPLAVLSVVASLGGILWCLVDQPVGTSAPPERWSPGVPLRVIAAGQLLLAGLLFVGNGALMAVLLVTGQPTKLDAYALLVIGVCAGASLVTCAGAIMWCVVNLTYPRQPPQPTGPPPDPPLAA